MDIQIGIGALRQQLLQLAISFIGLAGADQAADFQLLPHRRQIFCVGFGKKAVEHFRTALRHQPQGELGGRADIGIQPGELLQSFNGIFVFAVLRAENRIGNGRFRHIGIFRGGAVQGRAGFCSQIRLLHAHLRQQ